MACFERESSSTYTASRIHVDERDNHMVDSDQLIGRDSLRRGMASSLGLIYLHVNLAQRFMYCAPFCFTCSHHSVDTNFLLMLEGGLWE
jgi:hypothetical protein